MRLTTNNIRSVTEYIRDGVNYAYGVCMKSMLVSDNRTFINYDETGRTTVANYRFDSLPKAVQKFIGNAVENGRYHFETENDFVRIVYR